MLLVVLGISRSKQLYRVGLPCNAQGPGDERDSHLSIVALPLHFLPNNSHEPTGGIDTPVPKALKLFVHGRNRHVKV